MNAALELLQSSAGLLLTNLLVQLTLLAALSLLAALVFRHSPITRYGILFPALLSLALLIPVSLTVQLTNASLINLPIADVHSARQESVTGFLLEPALSLVLELEEFIIGDERTTAGLITRPSSAVDFKTDTSVVPESRPSISILLIAIWFVGFLIVVARIFNSHKKLSIILNQAQEIRGEQKALVAEIIDELNLDGLSVRIKASSQISGPIVAGLTSPTILMPTLLIPALGKQQLASVLVHELAHLQRNDLLANYLQRIARGLFWFHPLVWKMDKLISQAREEICDNYVLAQQPTAAYGEALLKITTVQNNLESGMGNAPLAMGMFNNSWALEDRIRDLLDENRETAMRLSHRKSQTLKLLTLLVTAFLAACQIAEVSNPSAEQATRVVSSNSSLSRPLPMTENNPLEPRLIPVQSTEPASPRSVPEARTADTLSDEVFRMVEEIQTLLSPEDEAVEPNLPAAKLLLDELTVNRYDSLNDFEKQTALNFLTNYYLTLEEYQNATAVFERILNIGAIRADTRLRTLRSLGQLTSHGEEWQRSINYYDQWRDLSVSEDQLVYKGLSYAHYQQEQWQLATQYWQDYMDLVKQSGEELTRDDYVYLNGLYFTTEDLDSALELMKEMILLFNDETDWANLRTIYTMLDARDQLDETADELLGQLENAATEPTISQTSLTPEDGDYLPLIAVAPLYPRSAANDGIEGWVLVEFTVTKEGLVESDSVEVKDAEPASVFDTTSIRAAKQFEFSPRIINSEAVAVPGVQYLFRFELGEEV